MGSAAQAAGPVVLTIAGVPKPLALTVADIAAMPHFKVEQTLHGKAISCEGPWLTDVLAAAGVPASETVRGPGLTMLVVAEASDGYRVAFTVGELDHLLGNAAVIVADRCGGAALPAADGPVRLIAAGDKRGARSVRQLETLTIGNAP